MNPIPRHIPGSVVATTQSDIMMWVDSDIKTHIDNKESEKLEKTCKHCKIMSIKTQNYSISNNKLYKFK